MKFRKADLLWLATLALAVSFLWCLQHDRLSLTQWKLPIEYGFDAHLGDSHQNLAWIKTAADGNFIPFWSKTVPQLGAPFEANWNDFPMFDEVLLFCFGLLARLFGLFEASNLAVMLGVVTSAVSFYVCCRLFRYDRIWAWVGATLFSFMYFGSFRGLGHLTVGYVYTVPLAIVVCWIIGASKRLHWGDRFCWLCLGTAAVIGLSNPYYLNMFCQLLCLALVLQFFTLRRKPNLLIGVTMLSIAMLAFVAVNLDTFGYQFAHGRNPEPMARSYYESELFGLKIIELFMPPPDHHIAALAALGQKYGASAYIKGELFAPYLGFIGLLGLAWMAVEIVRLGLKPARRPLPVIGLQSLWVLLYSTVAGFNCLLAIGGLTLFRATNRFSIFLSALSLLFLVSRLSVVTRRWQLTTRLLVAGGALILGLYDELPRSGAANQAQTIAQMVEADRAFTAKMEAALPAGAMIFELPVMIFPESTPKHQLLPYELLRPYLFTKTLRFSFGDNKGRPRGYWQWELDKLPPDKMVANLEKYGFAAIYLNRRGYPDRGEQLLKGFAAAGKTNVFEDALREQVCILLSPAAKPELPASASEAAVSYRRNWVVFEGMPPERQVWSSGNATLSFYNPGKEYRTFKFKCAIGSMNRRKVALIADGRELWRSELSPGQAVPIELSIDARPGNNIVEIQTDEPPVMTANQGRPPVAVVLINLRVTPASN